MGNRRHKGTDRTVVRSGPINEWETCRLAGILALILFTRIDLG